jgi:hypothetical protein
MTTPVSPARSLTTFASPRPGGPVGRLPAPGSVFSPDAGAPGTFSARSYAPSQSYPAYPSPSSPSLWNGLKLVAQGLGEILWVTARAGGTVLRWAGVAAVAVLGVAWDVTKAVFNALARGVRAIFDPGYDPYRPWQYGDVPRSPAPDSNWRF